MNKPTGASLRNVVVVASTSLITFLTFGTSRLSAQLYVACIDRFNTGRKEASLPFVLCFTGKNLSGPIVGYLGNKYGLKSVTLAGCLLSAVSIGGCYFVEDIVPFTVLWGGFFGIGFGMGTVLIPTILRLYFIENFNLVFGIVLSSGCIGSLVLPVIIDSLLKNYGTSGALLILSSLVLHCIPAAMLLNKPEMPRTHQSHSTSKETNESLPQNYQVEDTKDCETSSTLDSKYREGASENTISPRKSNSLPTYELGIDSHNELETEISMKANIIDINKLTESKSLALPISSGVQVVENIDNATKVAFHIATEIVLNETSIHTESKEILSDSNRIARIQHEATSNESSATPQNVLTRDLKTKNDNSEILTQRNSSNNLKIDKHVERTEEKHQAKLPSTSAFRKFEIFLDPAYILILVSIGLSFMVATTLFTVIVDACRDKGITEDVAVLMIFALTDMMGRLSFGYIADRGCITPIQIFSLSCGSLGLLIIGFTWISGFYTVMVFVAGLGTLLGGTLVLPVGIIANYVQKENFTMAVSSRYLLFAFFSFSQSPVIGYFRETLRSYNGLFYLLGGTCFLETIITLFVPLAARWRDNRRNSKISSTL